MNQNVKKFLQFLSGLGLLIGASPALGMSSACGFVLEDAKASKALNGVPLYVENSTFRPNTLELLKKRALREKKKLENKKSCPKTEAHVQKVVDRIFKGSNLEFLQKGSEKLEVVLLCSKTDMPPVARIVAGKYLIIPSSLPLQAESEDAMAAVISHEIAHYTLRHHARLIESSSGRSPAVGFNEIKKEHEKEADLAGLKLLTNAGYNPASTIAHLKNVRQIVESRRPANARSSGSHPTANTRVFLLHQQIKDCGYELVKDTVSSTKELVKELRRYIRPKNS